MAILSETVRIQNGRQFKLRRLMPTVRLWVDTRLIQASACDEQADGLRVLRAGLVKHLEEQVNLGRYDETTFDEDF